jgi:EAL domain-containing protein (putative c-di-GMP-specific phosphodiesterase class I)
MKNADSAMYRSKEAGKNRYSFFSFELNERAMYRLQIENNLRYALEKQELFLVFQPQISLSTQKIVGAECLIRWKSAELGFVPPDAFISIAEETGMIISIGAFVLSEACREATSWIDILGEPIRLSVNVSSKQFRGIDFHTMVKQVLDSTGYSAENLEIEITESILVTDVEHTVQILNRLVDDGISISVDDFGTGYSSLSYLKRFPIATLKIDKSFINHITTDAGDQALSKAIIAMGHSLGMEVIAEGVEHSEQIEQLRLYNCDTIQGYFYSKPLASADFRKFLEEHRSRK